MNLQNWKPVKDYAELNNMTVQGVYQAIKRGKLVSKKIGTYTLVYDSD